MPEHTRVTVFGRRPLSEMSRADRVRAVYQHASLHYVLGQKVTNTSVRERFKIDPHNSARATALLREALEDGLIMARNPEAGVKIREYLPFWAAAET